MFGINSEADSLMKQLFEYAVRERDRGVYDFTEIISGFYRKLDLEYNDIPTRNSFTNRLLRIMKEYVETDPRYQGKIDNYLNKSATNLLEISGGAEIDESQLRYPESI